MNKKILIITGVLIAVSAISAFIFWPDETAISRPQEPKMPYPYVSEDVTFQNKEANITLSATLTLPAKEGNYPAVILITGSGPQNRNEEVAGHKPFLVISDHLTRNGIAVLRYDDRGFGQSTGDFKSATSLDFARDVESAISYLKTRPEINKGKIGLVGHSEGGMIAPIVASQSPDVNFIVLLAAPGIKGDKLLLMQSALMGRAMGLSEPDIQKSLKVNAAVYGMIEKSDNPETLKADLTRFAKDHIEDMPDKLVPPNMTKEEFVAANVDALSTPWWQYLLKYDPVPIIEKVTCAVLVLNGEKDLQVPPKENLAAIGEALKKGGNPKITIKELPDLNHFFQECDTGSPAEYAKIEQTFSPVALTEISAWILKQ
ncbi:alpha/beta hydrolase family protein [Dyadobacter bucti]|uniref:alpha/beta hydrolase family protein n=1 Tax=Dyadobacter bucti TaxID=2572203 RepID=UPI003F71A1BF